MGALYFIPARRFPDGRVPDTVKGPALAALGLGHLAGAPLTYRVVYNSGPDGGAGLCIGLRVDGGKTGVFKDEQRWHACNGGDLWFGWDAGEVRPGPETFLRDRALSATVTTPLGDGNRWGFLATSALPERAVFDNAGQPTWAPRAEDSAHYEASKWLMEYVQDAEPRAYFEIIDRVAVCLAARYHVSSLELIALGLFTTDLNATVVYACLGIDLNESDEKKSEA